MQGLRNPYYDIEWLWLWMADRLVKIILQTSKFITFVIHGFENVKCQVFTQGKMVNRNTFHGLCLSGTQEH